MSIIGHGRIVTAMVVLVVAAGLSAAHAGKIYFFALTYPDSGIYRANLDGTGVELVVPASTHGLAVDPVARKVYWGQAEPGGPGTILRRANLDGSNPEDLHDLAGALPDALALDRQAGRVYLSANYLDDCSGIVRYRMDGTGSAESVVSGVCAIGVAVDPGAGKLYWAEESPNRAIRRANLDGSAPEIVIDWTPSTPRALALDEARGKLYWSCSSSGEGGGVVRADTDGSNVETVVPPDEYPAGVALDLNSDKLYWQSWVSLGKLRRANLDGSDSETIIDEVDATGQLAIDPTPDGPDVPAVSFRGLLVLALVVLGIAAVVIRGRAIARAGATG